MKCRHSSEKLYFTLRTCDSGSVWWECVVSKSEIMICVVLTVVVTVETASCYSNSSKSWAGCVLDWSSEICVLSVGQYFCCAGDGESSAAWLMGTECTTFSGVGCWMLVHVDLRMDDYRCTGR
jgi:hypothetical protein